VTILRSYHDRLRLHLFSESTAITLHAGVLFWDTWRFFNRLESKVFGRGYLSWRWFSLGGHQLAVFWARVANPTVWSPGPRRRRAVGVIKGFLLKELPTRSRHEGGRVAMSSGGEGLQASAGARCGKAKVIVPDDSSGSSPGVQSTHDEVAGKELVVHGMWQVDTPADEDEVL
jgi:hypothetical protein